MKLIPLNFFKEHVYFYFELSLVNSIVNVFVSNNVGEVIMQFLEESNSEAFMTIEPNFFDFEDNRGGFTAKASVYFVFVSFFFVIAITLSWVYNLKLIFLLSYFMIILDFNF
jgi:hypothetical protein